MSEHKVLDLNSLDVGIPAVTARQAGVHMEASVWCLSTCGHGNDVPILVNDRHDQSQETYLICWPENEVDIDAINRAYNREDAVELGTVAIALLLVREKTEYSAIRRSVTSTGIDYWLASANDEKDQIFSHESARLEVSGILRKSRTNRVAYRVNQKQKQTERSDYTSFPAFVVVVEFSQPEAELSRRYV